MEQLVHCLTNGLPFCPRIAYSSSGVHSASGAVSLSVCLTVVFAHTEETNEFHMKTEKWADSNRKRSR